MWGQNLPISLPCERQKIDEAIRFFAKWTNAISGWQGRYRKQNALFMSMVGLFHALLLFLFSMAKRCTFIIWKAKKQIDTRTQLCYTQNKNKLKYKNNSIYTPI
jgi:hypothetical protein